jgi:hypothetical protein
MSYQIAIPSHRRPGILREKTLAFLQRSNVDMDRVLVVLSDEEDAQSYNLGTEVAVHVAVDAKNVVDKFNCIHYRYPKGTNVFVMEDDVTLIEGLEKGSNEKQELTDLDGLIKAGFGRLPFGGLWGVAPHDNSFFFSMQAKEGLLLVVAHAFGFVSTHDPELAVTQIAKSDYERTLRYFVRYGSVHRMDWVGARTKSYTQAGGMQSDHSRDQRKAFEEEACAYLVKHYPDFIRHNLKKKSIFPELSFDGRKFTPQMVRDLHAQRQQKLAAEGA